MWFRKYKKDEVGSFSLCNHYCKTALKTMIVVSRPTSHGVYEYAAFQNYTKLFSYLNSLKEEDRILHEVPIHSRLQKPHFDIDINSEGMEDYMSFGENLRNRLLDRIATELENIGVPFTPELNLLIYNTHRKEKYSSHIIVPGVVHTNNRQAREFYNRVVEGDENLKKYVDHSIYDKNHSLRLVGCCKRESDVYKVLEREFLFRGKMYKHELPFIPDDEIHETLALFCESIICQDTSCLVIPDYYIESSTYDKDPIPDEEATEMLKLMILKFGEDSPFKFKSSSGNMIWLDRTRPSYCDVCERVHEAKGPSLQRASDGSVYFHCRRAEKKRKTYIGKVNPPANTEATSFFEDNLEDMGTLEWEGMLLQSFIDDYRVLEKTEKVEERKTEREGYENNVVREEVIIEKKSTRRGRRLTIRQKREKLTKVTNDMSQTEQARIDRTMLLTISQQREKKK